MSPSTDRVRTNIFTTPPGGMHLNSQRHSDILRVPPWSQDHIRINMELTIGHITLSTYRVSQFSVGFYFLSNGS